MTLGRSSQKGCSLPATSEIKPTTNATPVRKSPTFQIANTCPAGYTGGSTTRSLGDIEV